MEDLLYDEYAYTVYISMPKEVMSDEFYEKNKNIIEEILYGFYRTYDVCGELSPKIAKIVLTIFLESLKKGEFK